MKPTTIAAISTPFGSGGIGIIKISGQDSLRILERLFRRFRDRLDTSKGFGSVQLKSHQMCHGYIVDPETHRIIDEVLVVAMYSPRSYTREDVVEIHSHAGYVVLSQIYEKVLNEGASVAEPGEFTKRAFLNGRIDLTQAEAVVDIINAKTATSLHMAAHHLTGRLSEQIESIRGALKSIQVEIEADIDFLDDIPEAVQTDNIIIRLRNNAIRKLEGLISRYRNDHYFRDGVKMAVVGRPNVGKSSLMNCLIEKERVIVTAVPGTTRDIIEEMINVKGLPVIIMDTAGLRDVQEEVEKIGIEKTNQLINEADVILFLVDLANAVTSEDREILNKIEDKKFIIVQNKVDIQKTSTQSFLPEEWKNSPTIKVSAKLGTNINALKEKILNLVVGERGVNKEIEIVPNLRQKKAMEGCLVALNRAEHALIRGESAELIAIDISEAIDLLDGVIGYSNKDDVLDQIFSRFCIGK